METSNKKNVTKHHRICFVAGRSGGHILPCITLAQQAINRHPDYEVVFFSTDAPLDKQLLSGNPIIHTYFSLTLSPFNIKKIYNYPVFIWYMLVALYTSYRHLRQLKPETVITTGGYVAIPVCFAAKLLGIPIELYELNVVPGKTIKILAPMAHKIWVCFENSMRFLPAKKCTLTNYPIKFIDKTKIMSKTEALNAIQFSSDRKTLLVLGGSQGSVFINNLIRYWLEQNKEIYTQLQVIHQTGSSDSTDWHSLYTQCGIPAIVFSYSNDIGTYYAASDLVICRSGAGTLAEIMFFDKRCITIPLEVKTTMHQVDNALAAARKCPNLITVVHQKNIESTYQALFETIKQQLQISS